MSEDRYQIHEEICNKMHDTYVAKNSDYGNSFTKLREHFGNTSILIRLYDKLFRAEQLLMNGNQKVEDESIDDTLLDLANYAIMELTERKLERMEKLNEETSSASIEE